MNSWGRQTVAAAPFVAAGVLASGWAGGPLALLGTVALAAMGLIAGAEIGRWRGVGLMIAGVLLVGAGVLGTFGAGMVGGVLFGNSGYVAGAGWSDYRVLYGGIYFVMALVLAAGALAVVRKRHPPVL